MFNFGKFIVVGFLAALPLVLLSSIQQPPIKIKNDKNAVKFASQITADSLRKYLSILAHDSLAGRATEDAAFLRAAQFIKRELQASGIQSIPINPTWKGGYFQPVPLKGSTWDEFTLTNGTTKLRFPTDFFLDKSTARFISKTGFSGDYFIVKGFAKPDTNFRNKIIVLAAPSASEISTAPAQDQENLAYKQAKSYIEQGARIVLIEMSEANFALYSKEAKASRMRAPVTLKSDETETEGNRHAYIYLPTEKLLKLAGINTAAWESFKKGTSDKLALSKVSILVKALPKDTTIYRPNVIGFIPGKNAKETLFLSAHLDHLGFTGGGICNGADDDGSGSAGLLTIAKTFQRAVTNGWKPNRNIAFIWFTGEERGLLGSDYYGNNPALPMAETVTDINIDMIGRNDDAHTETSSKPFIYVIGSNMLSTELHQLNEAVAQTYSPVKHDYTYADPADKNRFYYRSDHYNFAKHGVPVIFYFNGVHDNYHQPSDEVHLIDLNSYALRTQLAFHLAWELAQRKERVFVDKR